MTTKVDTRQVIDGVTYLGPQELIDFLVTGPGKTKEMFESPISPDKRCCLGHYAHLQGIPFTYSDTQFEAEYECNVDESYPLPMLPEGHWLLQDSGQTSEHGWSYTHQDMLAKINDATDDFSTVISYLTRLVPA